MTGDGNNTYLLADEGGAAVLIDAGVGDPRHLEDLAAALDRSRARLSRVVVTHGHSDHAAGAPAIAAVHPDARFAKRPWPGQDERFAVAWDRLDEGDTVDAG